MRKHILLGRGRCINRKNMYNDTKTVSLVKNYGGRPQTVVKDVNKYQNKVFKPLRFKNLKI